MLVSEFFIIFNMGMNLPQSYVLFVLFRAPPRGPGPLTEGPGPPGRGPGVLETSQVRLFPTLKAGFRNAGFRNAGFRNAGFRNAAFRNAGFRNAGFRNAGFRNAGFHTFSL